MSGCSSRRKNLSILYREDDLEQFQVLPSEELAQNNDFMTCESKIDDWIGEPPSLVESCITVSGVGTLSRARTWHNVPLMMNNGLPVDVGNAVLT